ncbi:unnamed protein product [Ceutorhynchus assimilis]|uniref:Uncharacterized protein n=1 Tax=Ceutorhynchus assimilis TaxID=467358 RepID=A0A9N9MBP8_9CUCU|nr:unnamed protein product [Ceutorhynchus assimilis]
MHSLPVALALFMIMVFLVNVYGDVASDLQNLGQKFSGQVQQWGQQAAGQAQQLGEQALDAASKLAQNLNGPLPTGK